MQAAESGTSGKARPSKLETWYVAGSSEEMPHTGRGAEFAGM